MNQPKTPTPATELSASPWRAAAGKVETGVILDANGQTVATVTRTTDAGVILAIPELLEAAAAAAGALQGCAIILKSCGMTGTASTVQGEHDRVMAALLRASEGACSVRASGEAVARLPS